MNAEHAKLLAELRRAARPTFLEKRRTDSYGGSGHRFYDVSVPSRRSIAKGWLAAHKTMGSKQFLGVVGSLFRGKSHEEKTLAALLLGYHRTARMDVRLDDIDRWLDKLNGWAEIDSLCQNVFTAAEMESAWSRWKIFVKRLSKESNINKRRAALVLLTGPVRHSDDSRFRDLAFAIIAPLRAERDILITKAISWLLRSMVTRHRDAVVRYLNQHETSLPKIALRETRTKLKTGTKSGRQRSTGR